MTAIAALRTFCGGFLMHRQAADCCFTSGTGLLWTETNSTPGMCITAFGTEEDPRPSPLQPRRLVDRGTHRQRLCT